MTQDELNVILAAHKEWFEDGSKGSRANLSGADLRRAALIGANLSGANLYGADLYGADLRRANLHGADLYGADLRWANLRGADLSGANLHGANLHGADLYVADLRSAALSGANLYGANLSGANLRWADLRGAYGNNDQIKTIQTGVYVITYTDEIIQIGCERHRITDWFNFDDQTIDKMDTKALEFWKKWKPILKLIIEDKTT